MRDFRELLIENGRYKYLNKTYSNRLILGEYGVSIQMGKRCYSNPNIEFDSINKYESMEVALFKNGNQINIANDEYIKNFKRYEDLLLCLNGDDYLPVMGYVTTDLIQDLCEYLSDEVN